LQRVAEQQRVVVQLQALWRGANVRERLRSEEDTRKRALFFREKERERERERNRREGIERARGEAREKELELEREREKGSDLERERELELKREREKELDQGRQLEREQLDGQESGREREREQQVGAELDRGQDKTELELGQEERRLVDGGDLAAKTPPPVVSSTALAAPPMASEMVEMEEEYSQDDFPTASGVDGDSVESGLDGENCGAAAASELNEGPKPLASSVIDGRVGLPATPADSGSSCPGSDTGIGLGESTAVAAGSVAVLVAAVATSANVLTELADGRGGIRGGGDDSAAGAVSAGAVDLIDSSVTPAATARVNTTASTSGKGFFSKPVLIKKKF
jgi:hypothetical protein